MIYGILSGLQWSLSFGTKCFRVAPLDTTIVVWATLVSQVAILLAFFLPLKVVILLGSEGMPRYFPASFANVERDLLIVSLSASAIASYLIHLASEYVTTRSAEHGARRLLERSRKTVLFKNQEEVASSGYKRYTSVLASVIFAILAVCVLVVFYPGLALNIAGYSVLVFVALLLAYRSSEALRSRLEAQLTSLMSMIGAIGFLVAFAYLVGDFILGSPPGLLVAIISLLLTKQLYSRIAGLVSDLAILYRQRIRLNALFFHGHALHAGVEEHEPRFWSLLDRQQRAKWLPEVISGATGAPIYNSDTRWISTEIPGVAAIHVSPDFLVRLFDKGRRSTAQHEITLLSECRSKLPALPLSGVDAVGGYSCHIFKGYAGEATSGATTLVGKLLDVRTQLLGTEPPPTLIDRYKRSRPLLPQRITRGVPDRLLSVVAEGAEREMVGQFGRELDRIRAKLSALPLWIHNPHLQASSLGQDASGRVVVIDWGRWSLEPVGAGWPVKGSSLNAISDVLSDAAAVRRDLVGVVPDDFRLAALVFSLETLYLGQRYSAILSLLPSIMDCLNSRESVRG